MVWFGSIDIGRGVWKLSSVGFVSCGSGVIGER